MHGHAQVTAIAVVAALLGTALFNAVSGKESPSVGASIFWYGMITILSVSLWNPVFALSIRKDRSTWNIAIISLWLPLLGACITNPPCGCAACIAYWWLFIPISFATGMAILALTK